MKGQSSCGKWSPEVLLDIHVVGVSAKHTNAASTHFQCAALSSNSYADDLRFNLWDLEHTAYCLADFTPTKIAFLREVLLSACFHPSDSALSIFLYFWTSENCGAGHVHCQPLSK